MSASPSGQSVGNTPNGGQPQYVRRAKAADPLRPRKKPVRRVPIVQAPKNTAASYPVSQMGVGGWTAPPAPGTFVDYPLFTTKRQMREGMRYHMAKFISKTPVDPRDQNKFTRPILLHRRDPKQGPPGKDGKDEKVNGDVLMDAKEREKQEILREQKEKQKAEDQAQIAPTGTAAVSKKAQAFRNEKTTQVHRLDQTAAQKKASDLRYEEALPWHLEDADNKIAWVGNYESALSESNVAFVADGSRFIMIPIEKWYKFIPTGQFTPLTTEEAEASLSKKTKESRWKLRDMEKNGVTAETEKAYKAYNSLYAVKAESGTFKNSGKRETEDMDELDFEGDELFQDDDDQNTVDKIEDEDTKEAQEKIKRDQLAANVFDQANEEALDKEFEKEMAELEKDKNLSKEMKKALRKRERNLVYADDSDSDPYASKSEDETSDEEKQQEIDRKKDEEAKKLANTDPKAPSGASSKGTNTPSGHPRHSDPLTKGTKRPGSPNLSESSGNESTRKKLKKKFHSSQPTGSSTPMSGSRQASPAPSTQPGQSSRKPSVLKLSNNPSHSHPSVMDVDSPGGNASDGGHKKKKIKLTINNGSPSGSRAGSRVGSPAPVRAGSVASGSRPGSPARQTPAGDARVQPEEIVRVLEQSAGGISAKALIAQFKSRLDGPGQLTQKEFIQQIKMVAKYGADKLLRPK